MTVPKISQQNFRILLPSKIAMTVAMIARQDNCTEIEALMKFYSSRTYENLEKEATKFWWMSPLQLFREYQWELDDSTPSDDSV